MDRYFNVISHKKKVYDKRGKLTEEYKNGKYVYLNEATPGKENSGKFKLEKENIKINEKR